MDEAELVEACRRRERQAQKELYDRYAPLIYRLVLRLAGNAQDAFDLTQETFVRALGRIATFDGRAGLATWLYRVATNEALQLFRRRRVDRRHLRAYAEQQAAAGEPPDPLARQEVDRALGRISADHRAVLILRYQEGLTYQQIAAVLDCPAGTVASRLNRARAELKAALAGETPAGAEDRDGLMHQSRQR